MKILLIDDDPEIFTRLSAGLSGWPLDWSHAHTVEAGLEKLSCETFDLIVCDLNMPVDEQNADLAVHHGLQAAEKARELAAGTPLLIYSGFRKDAEFESLIGRAHPANLYGAGEVEMVRSFDKTKPDLIYEAIGQHCQGLMDLGNAVDLTNAHGGPPDLSEYDKRLLRIYARSRGGAVATVEPMDGGRSKARTLRLEVRDSSDNLKAQVVAKLSCAAQVIQEATAFDEHVAGRLGAGMYADSTRRITAGAGRRGGTFYSFASGHQQSLFELLAVEPDLAGAAVSRLEKGLKPWDDAGVGTTPSLRELCESICPSSKWSCTPHAPEVKAIGDLSVPLSAGSSHGDLHGGNVLVAPDGSPMLIDFADAAVAPSLLDPVTLELSVVCHPDSPYRISNWPQDANATAWHDKDAWLDGCPIGAFIGACIDWELRLRRGSRDRDAVMLAYALGQLAHPNPRTEVLSALIGGAVSRLASS